MKKGLLLFFFLALALSLYSQTRPSFLGLKDLPVYNIDSYGRYNTGTLSVVALVESLMTNAPCVIQFGDGTYLFDADCGLLSNVTIRGNGRSTVLLGSSTTGRNVFRNGEAVVKNVTIENLHINGNKTTTAVGNDVEGIYLSSTNNLNTPHESITIRNCLITNCSVGIGIELGYNIVVDNCQIFNMRRNMINDNTPAPSQLGYGVVLNGCGRSSVRNCIIGGFLGVVDRHCIYLSQHLLSDGISRAVCSNISITGNNLYCQNIIASDSASIPLPMRAASFVTITDNHISGGAFANLEIDCTYEISRNITINGNQFSGPTGIRIIPDETETSPSRLVENVIITNNQFRDVTTENAQFIEVTGGNTCIIKNNFAVASSTSPAISFGGLATTTVLAYMNCGDNYIEGFNVGYYVRDVKFFTDTNSFFKNLTELEGYPRLYEYVNVAYQSTRPLSEYNYWDLTDTTQIAGMNCYIASLSADVVGGYDSVASYTWFSKGRTHRLYGTTAQRPASATTPLGTKYFNIGTGNMNMLNASSTSSIPEWR